MVKYDAAIRNIKASLGDSHSDDIAALEQAIQELHKLKQTLSKSKRVESVEKGERVGYAYIAKNSKVLYLCEERHAGFPHVFPIYRG